VRRAYRHVVVGAGGIGSATAYWLSRRAGDDVLCLEQWALGNALGASEDHSRIIRLGYHAERYTALTADAYAAWRVAEDASGVPLVHRTGMVNLAPAGSPGTAIIDAYVEAMGAGGIPFERLDARAVTERWPQFRLTGEHDALFQPDGGILDIRRGGAVHRALATAAGATVLADHPVLALRATDAGVELDTPQGTVRAEQVVLCAGAWNRGLLAQLGVDWPIRLTQEQVTYYATRELRRFAPDRFPIWIWHGDAEFYGFPVFGEVATKAAEDLGGPAVDPQPSSWEPDRERIDRVTRFLDDLLPGYTGPELYTRCCLYDMPPDRDFVLDRVPGHPNVLVAVGAGHAAKFAALFGRILSELVLDGGSAFPIGPFRADRAALTDAAFPPAYRLGPVPA
jgi:sarcosine oxidase